MRIDAKLRGKKIDGVMNRLHIAMPKPRDDVERPPFIPENVLKKRQIMEVGESSKTRRLERDIELEQGDDYILDMKSKKKNKTNRSKNLALFSSFPSP